MWNCATITGKGITAGSYLAVIIITDKDNKTEVLKTIVGVTDNK